MFNKEAEIFKVAYEGMLKHIDIIDNVGKRKEVYGAGVGLEGFFQFVLLDIFFRKGYSVRMKGKRERDCDVIVEGIGVELRTLMDKTTNIDFLRKCFEEHPKADCYMFLTRTMLKDNLFKYLEENGYAERYEEINPYWMIWLIKKK